MSNGMNTSEDTEMAECDGEKVVTMMDVLQEQQEFEEDANAVLGASDDNNCTYLKGYIKRQAIYACLTCCTEAKTDPSKRAGVCLACSLTCHENHELIELYTKRNFRCDCGNPKFSSHPCQYTSDKTDLNEENKYNQNFSGLYCVCHRPYPDPTFEDEMIQCIICEDWLHSSHLDATVPGNDQYAEMICKSCMDRNDFLHDYSALAVNNEMAEVDVLTVNKDLTNYISVTNGDIDESKLNSETKTSPKENVDESETKVENSEVNINTGDISKEQSQSSSTNGGNPDKESTHTNETQEAQDDSNKKPSMDEMDESSADVTRKLDELIGESVSTNSDLNNDAVSNEDTLNDVPSEKSQDENGEDISGTEKLDITNKDNGEVTEKSDKMEVGQENEVEEDNKKLEDNIQNQTNPNDMDDENKNSSKTDNETILPEDSISASTDKIDALPTEDKLNTNDKDVSMADSEKVQEVSPKIDNTENANVEDKIVSDDFKTDDISQTSEIDTLSNDNNKDDVDEEKSPIETKNDLKSEENSHENKRKLSTDEVADDITIKKPKLLGCVRPCGVKKTTGATFWPSTFRQKLCTCSECLSMYKDLSVLFLIDPEDTVTAYETLGKERTEGNMVSQYEKGLEALSSLDRIQQINALTEYNKMRDKLLDFLKSFKEKKEVVKEEDIKAFFAGMKPKREPDGVYFCR